MNDNGCQQNRLDRMALALIKQLIAEIEVLKAERDNYKKWYFQAVVEIGELRQAYANYEETTGLKQARADTAREIFEEIEKILKRNHICSVLGDIAQLKKKYTDNEVHWSKQGKCPVTPEQFEAIYEESEDTE